VQHRHDRSRKAPDHLSLNLGYENQPRGLRHRGKTRGDVVAIFVVSELADEALECRAIVRPGRADDETAHSHSIVPGGLLV
jgi:hypothetical protein